MVPQPITESAGVIVRPGVVDVVNFFVVLDLLSYTYLKVPSNDHCIDVAVVLYISHS